MATKKVKRKKTPSGMLINFRKGTIRVLGWSKEELKELERLRGDFK